MSAEPKEMTAGQAAKKCALNLYMPSDFDFSDEEWEEIAQAAIAASDQRDEAYFAAHPECPKTLREEAALLRDMVRNCQPNDLYQTILTRLEVIIAASGRDQLVEALEQIRSATHPDAVDGVSRRVWIIANAALAQPEKEGK